MTPRLIAATFLTLIIWLLFGAPTELTAQTAVFLFTPIISVWLVIWSNLLFQLLGSDSYNYALVGKALNGFGFVITLSSGLMAFYVYEPVGNLVKADVPGFVWIGMVIGLFVPFWVPLATGRSASSLPIKDAQRDYSDPS